MTRLDVKQRFLFQSQEPHPTSGQGEKKNHPGQHYSRGPSPGGQETLQDQSEGLLYWFRIPVDEKHGAQSSCVCLSGTTETYLGDRSVSCVLVQTSSSRCHPLWFM